jgi:hypothetical protein
MLVSASLLGPLAQAQVPRPEIRSTDWEGRFQTTVLGSGFPSQPNFNQTVLR